MACQELEWLNNDAFINYVKISLRFVINHYIIHYTYDNSPTFEFVIWAE